MDLTSLKLIAAVAIFFIAAVAGWFPFRKKALSLAKFDFPRGEALACGIFLGAALIHMLSNANYNFSQLGIHYPLAFLLCGVSFLLLLLLEHLSSEISEHEGKNTASVALLAVIMLAIHSLFEGAALGLSGSLSTAVLILIAILAHKWAASFSLAVQINKSDVSFKLGIVAFAIFTVMTPIGILLGNSIVNFSGQSFIEPIFTAIAAGTFLYIGTLHGLKRSVMIERCCNLRDFSFVIIGFGLMALVALWT